MGLFEFLMVLISVVIGLGVTEVLTGVANLLRVRETVRFYWIHGVFQFGIFFALLQQWWESWDLSGVDTVSFYAAVFLLLPSIVLFLIAHLLFPHPAANADLEEYYYRQAPLLWSLVILGTIEGTFVLPLFSGEEIFHPTNLSGMPMIVICAGLVWSKRRRVHGLLVPIVLLLVVLDTLLTSPAISMGG